MARFIIRGKHPLTGVFQPAGNKNAILPMLTACLLTDETVELDNVPLIEDVFTMLEILADLGVSVRREGHRVILRAAGLRKLRLKRELCHRVRSAILFAGPLLARHGQAVIYPPGGDVIGRRRLDTHFLGLQALGAEIMGTDRFVFRGKHLRGANILLDEASVTATENVMMAATLAAGVTTLFNAACEPHVQDLGELLNKMGARVSGLGTNLIRVEGVGELHGASHRIGPDHIEIGSFLAAAAVTGGELTIPDVRAESIAPLMRPFQVLGLAAQHNDGRLHLAPRRKLRVQPDFGKAMPQIEDGPWPGFPSDLMSVAIVVGTQAQGTALFFEKMFESRLYFVDRLIDMGAQIVQCDPHRVVVIGPASLRGLHVSSPDIRAGMAMLIAALCARGTSTIENAQVIDRGYERVEERLRLLGADIIRED